MLTLSLQRLLEELADESIRNLRPGHLFVEGAEFAGEIDAVVRDDGDGSTTVGGGSSQRRSCHPSALLLWEMERWKSCGITVLTGAMKSNSENIAVHMVRTGPFSKLAYSSPHS
jgi:hypothetical protein